MPGMSLKLVLAWLCFVLVRFGVVVGSSSNPATNSDEMKLKPSNKVWPRAARLVLDDNPCLERDAFDLSGLDNFNGEMSEHQIQLERKRITACLELLGIIAQPLVGDQLIESRNPDGSIGWILEMISKEDRKQMVEDMQVYELIGYLSVLTGMPSVREVSTIYLRQALKIDVSWFYIISISKPTPKPTSTNPNKKSITYKDYLEVLKPLKKITSPDHIRIVGESTEKVILDQLELLLFLLRIADSPIIRIDWIDESTTPLDAKSVDRFRPLLEDIPAELKKKELVIRAVNVCTPHAFWDAFLGLVGEKYDIEVTFMKVYPLVPPNANPT